MENYFEPNLTDDQLRAISSIGLAHMGDAVFEVLVRTWLCAHGKAPSRHELLLHQYRAFWHNQNRYCQLPVRQN